MAKSKPIHDALDRLAAAEEEFLRREFLAPVFRGSQVQVRIAGVVCRLRITPENFEGWGVFRPVSHTEANLVRPCRLAERQRYLELFPLVRLILTSHQEEQWQGIPAHRADGRFQIEGVVAVLMVEDAQLFETIQARFDGCHFWYAGPDPRWDPARGAFLRQALEQMTEPDKLRRPGLTAEERDAYAICYWPRYQTSEETRRGREEKRLQQALEHAGAELRGYIEKGDVYTVTYVVDGQRHVSAVSKKNLAVQVAGICLSGRDRQFDLQSLVGVIREAQGGRGHLVRIGRDNQGVLGEEQYWQVHPPPRE